MYRLIRVSLPIAVLAMLTVVTQAAVLEVDSISTTPATTSATDTSDAVVLNAVTVGSNTYTVIELPTKVTVPDANRFWAINGSDPGSDAATLTDANLDTGLLNPASVVAQWGRTIGLNEVFIYMDLDRDSGFGRFDGITIAAVDSGGNVIGDYSRTISDNTSPNFLYEQNVERESGGTLTEQYSNMGYSFTLGDLTGTTGDLSLATGIRVVNAGSGNPGNSDPTMIAIVDVPEPASMALLGLGGALILRRRRA